MAYIPYDKNWKEITTQLTSDFIEFFLPDLFKMIDFSVPFEHLEQELLSILEQKDKANKRRKTTDKLVKVKLLDQTIHWIYIHVINTKKDAQQRLEYKKRLFELTEKANYTKTQALYLHYFVSELMLLPDDLEEEMDTIYTKSSFISTNKDMKYSQRTLNMADAMARGAFGISVTEAQEQLKKSVVLLYKRFQMSIDEIAEELGQEPKKVYNILVTAKVITE